MGKSVKALADSVNSNIIEGYGRRMYKQDFLRFLRMSHSSCDETSNHIKKIMRVYPDLETARFDELNEKYISLSVQIHNFIEYVKNNWRT
uniref:four helix bundle protein n=1 Tax=Chryseobacterium suipulveris TaxID=2929800 RepID=UPI00294FFDB9|nr:four helix bundle protein [Chryseobacterium suipulveris]